MSVRRSVLGEIAIRDGQWLSGVDVGSLVRRLLIFDRAVIKSFRLREIPFLVRTFGKTGFSELLNSGLIGFSCGFTSIAVEFSRDGIRSVPLDHFTFGIVSAANPDADLRLELRALQSITGLKNMERASLEEAVWRSLVRQPGTYGQELLSQIDSDLRTNTPALKAAIVERLGVKMIGSPVPVAEIAIEVEEPNARVFHIKNSLSKSFGISPQEAHLVLQHAVSGVASLDQRLADMQVCSAITGFRDSEAPLLFGKLAGLIAPLNPQTVEKQFERVIELTDIPDFKPGQKINVEALLRVRDSAECRGFREWLPTLEDRSDAEIRDAVSAIRAKIASLANSMAGKLVRLAATTGIGLIPGCRAPSWCRCRSY